MVVQDRVKPVVGSGPIDKAKTPRLRRQETTALALRRAIALAPSDAGHRLALAQNVARSGDAAEAAELFHHVLAMEPANAAAHAGLAQALISLGRLGEAEDELERALALEEENLTARLGRARLRLLQGAMDKAWDDFEWRWQSPGLARPEGFGETWDGSPLDGAAILLWAEQRLEDSIQLARYVPKVAAMGGRVVLVVPAPLVSLMKGLDGAAHVVASGAALPAGLRIAHNASLFDLPRLFATTVTSIPADIPYLNVPDDRPRIAAPPGAVLKVGLAWGSGRPTSSIPLTQLMPWFAMPDVAFFSLQIGPQALDSFKLAHPSLITGLSSTISDFADMAARIAEMDLVVTVDGSVAHIAGALGKPALVLLPHAPDWRWMLGRDDSPWYPSLTLIRQDRPGDWRRALSTAERRIHALADEAASQRAEAARSHMGAKAAMRIMLEKHIQGGDAFIDIGAADGTFTLDAASHPSGDVRVLAIEAKRLDAEMLSDTVAITGLEDMVEIIPAPVASRSSPVVVAKRARHGRTVFPLPEWVAGRSQTVAVDMLINDRPELADRRLVLRIGTKTSEAEVLEGLWEALATQRAAVIVFEHHKGAQAAEMLGRAGYSLHRFPSDIAGGPVKPFDGQPGPVLALASGLSPADAYGDVDDPTSPAALAKAHDDAIRLTAQGTDKLVAGERNEAARLLGQALAADPANTQANANMGILLRYSGRAAAAAACWKRALAGGFEAGIAVNLANVLRDMNCLDEALALLSRILDAEPTHSGALYAQAMIERKRGNAERSLALLEQCETVSPGSVPRYELAIAAIKAGGLARGLAELAHRPIPPDLPPAPDGVAEWNGERLNAQTILVRDEGDAIDTILLSRYIHQVGRQGGLVSVECVPEAARLMANLPGVEAAIPRGEALPATDFVVALPDLPRLIGTTSRTAPPRDVPYIGLPETMSPRRFPDDGLLNVGIVWAGRRQDSLVPLRSLLDLAANPALRLYSLQQGPRIDDLSTMDSQPFIEDLGSSCTDLADMAAIIAGLDVVVATDSVQAHLAAAMAKPTWVLLAQGSTWHWVEGREDSVWYPTMRVFRQDETGGWDNALTRIARTAAAMASR